MATRDHPRQRALRHPAGDVAGAARRCRRADSRNEGPHAGSDAHGRVRPAAGPGAGRGRLRVAVAAAAGPGHPRPGEHDSRPAQARGRTRGHTRAGRGHSARMAGRRGPPDHGVRIRRVPGDRVMALEGLGGYIDPGVVARVQAPSTASSVPASRRSPTSPMRSASADRIIPYSTVTAIDIDGYNRLSVPTGPPAPGTDT